MSPGQGHPRTGSGTPVAPPCPLPSHSSEQITAAIMQQLCTQHGLVDAFRSRHPTKKVYTFLGPTGASRLDRFHISASLEPFLLQCQAAAPCLSDHRLVTMRLSPREVRAVGPGSMRARGNHRQSPSLRQEGEAWVLSRLPTFPQPVGLTAPTNEVRLAQLAWFTAFKRDFRLSIVSLDRRQAAEGAVLGAPQRAALGAATEAWRAVEAADDPRPLLGAALLARSTAATACANPARQAELHRRHTWLREGERPSPLLSSILRPAQQPTTIPAIRTATGAVLTHGPAMAQEAGRFWANISCAQPRNTAEEQ